MTTPVSKPKRFALSLLSAGLATAAHAQGVTPPLPTPTELLNQWAQLVVYAVTPYCLALSNGLRVCQPIGLVGPAPGSAPGYQPLVQVPIAPPSIQPAWPPAIPVLPYAANPYLPATGMAMTPWQPPGGLPGGVTMPQPVPSADSQTPATGQAAAAPAQATEAAPAVASAAPLTQMTPAASAPSGPEPVPAAAPPTPVARPTVEAAPTPTAEPRVVQVVATGSAASPAPAGETVIVHFAFDSAQLTAAGRATLDAWLASGVKDAKIVIIGHADRLGPASYNTALSRRRAEAARAYLIAKGLDAGRIEIVAKGESQPVKHCKGGANPRTIACLAPNRRVEIDP